MPLRVRLEYDTIRIGRHVGVEFQRTLRLPDDGNTYPLPAGLGRFPLRRVSDHRTRVPKAWLETGGFFMPMHQHEAMWICFEGAYWRPNALKVSVGGVNAVSGGPHDERLRRDPQDYLVIPEQPWLDGIKAGEGRIRQFVAAPLGSGHTVEGRVTGKETTGGIQLTLFEPKPGRFPDRAPRARWGSRFDMADGAVMYSPAAPMVQEMGLGAGGWMRQSIYPDPHGHLTWDRSSATSVHVHLAHAKDWPLLTGEPVPPTPVTREAYERAGIPWFWLADGVKGGVGPSGILSKVEPVPVPSA